jgi:putative transcriptional regulator
LTQEQLAGQIGVSRKTVNTVENGVFIPSTVLALKMAKALRASVEELFFLTENSIETSL